MNGILIKPFYIEMFANEFSSFFLGIFLLEGEFLRDFSTFSDFFVFWKEDMFDKKWNFYLLTDFLPILNSHI